MKRRSLERAAIWSAATWPALNFLAQNWADVAAFGAASLAGTILITLCMGALGHAFHHLASRRNAGGSSVVWFVLFICIFFGYALIHDLSAALLFRAKLDVAPSLGWGVLALVTLVAVVLLRKHNGLQRAAIVFSLTGMVLALGSLLVAVVRSPSLESEPPSMARAGEVHPVGKSNGMNVYYILLDWYAGEAGLREFAGFDNSAFISAMTRRGFVDVTHGDSSAVRSNYMVTEQTLGAVFSLDFTVTDDPRTWQEPWHLFPYIINGTAAPPLVVGFKSSGYSVWQTFNTFIGCSGRHMRCLGGRGSLDFDVMTTAFMAPTPVGRAISLWSRRRDDALAALDDELATIVHGKQPSFVFAHSVLAHPPFRLDGNCSPQEEVGADYRGNEAARRAYVGTVVCTNSKVLKLVDRIQADDPEAAIVIQSDHGSAFTAEWEVPIDRWQASPIRERTSFLNLVKAPRQCARWLDRPMGQVNTARFVLACAQGRSPEYLPERTYLSTYAKGAGRKLVRLDTQATARN